MDNLNSLLNSGGGILLMVLMIALSGLVIGALARWIMPGPDPMSIPKTILLGISGSLVGGIVASLFRISPQIHPVWALLLQVGGALLVLWMVRRYRHRTVTP
ncbi:MAG TPA: GlsB/YeaQ/YmgE family stress response membrane protein [Terriglobales bacterium]|nr:GlsB/YeaQ/YmgE family stress response membrane protein [Terriglobales bacterium]